MTCACLLPRLLHPRALDSPLRNSTPRLAFPQEVLLFPAMKPEDGVVPDAVDPKA